MGEYHFICKTTPRSVTNTGIAANATGYHQPYRTWGIMGQLCMVKNIAAFGLVKKRHFRETGRHNKGSDKHGKLVQCLTPGLLVV
jgi:hypothetical protein